MLKSKKLTPTQIKLKKVLKPIVEGILNEENVPRDVMFKVKQSLEDSLTYIGYFPLDRDVLQLQKSIEDFLNKRVTGG